MPRTTVYTVAFNRPEFIPLQHRSLVRFMLDEFDLVVINNAADGDDAREIAVACDRIGVPCVAVEGNPHENINLSCGYGIQWAFENVISKQTAGTAAILDSDMFMLAPLSLAEFLAPHDIAGIPQSRGHVDYLWNGILFMDMDSLPERDTMNFMCGRVDDQPVDVGGMLHAWLHDVEPSVKFIGQTGQICSRNENLVCLPPAMLEHYEDRFRIEIVAGAFLHYGGGSNWDLQSDEYHASKTAFVRRITEATDAGAVALP